MTFVLLQGRGYQFVLNLFSLTLRASSVNDHQTVGISEGMKALLIFNTSFMQLLMTDELHFVHSSLKCHNSTQCLTLDIIKKKTLCGWTNPKSVWKNEAAWQCPLLLSDWLHELCVTLTLVAFQFKSGGQGFEVTLGFESHSDSNLTEQDEINEPWSPQGLLTPVCLSPGSRTCSLPPQLVWLPAGFIWMAVRMSWILPVMNLYCTVERLWSD